MAKLREILISIFNLVKYFLRWVLSFLLLAQISIIVYAFAADLMKYAYDYLDFILIKNHIYFSSKSIINAILLSLSAILVMKVAKKEIIENLLIEFGKYFKRLKISTLFIVNIIVLIVIYLANTFLGDFKKFNEEITK